MRMLVGCGVTWVDNGHGLVYGLRKLVEQCSNFQTGGRNQHSGGLPDNNTLLLALNLSDKKE